MDLEHIWLEKFFQIIYGSGPWPYGPGSWGEVKISTKQLVSLSQVQNLTWHIGEQQNTLIESKGKQTTS